MTPATGERKRIPVANVLPLSARIAVIAHLVEGTSVRATVRLTGVSKGAILRLLVAVGMGCAILHDRFMRNVAASVIEADELFAYVFKKEKRKAAKDPSEWGDAYTWTAMDITSRMLVSYLVGKRDPSEAYEFMQDLRDRVTGRPQLSTDGFGAYPDAVRRAFGYQNIDYGVVVKEYENSIDRQMAAAHRYSPGRVKSITKTVVYGQPVEELINTSHMERGNLTFRMQQRRFTRLTNAFSKKVENLKHSVALHVMHYNFVREHMTLETTPAVAGGIATRPWSLGELVSMALAASEEAGEPDPGDGGDDGGEGVETWVETVDPVTGEVSITWPRWTQATLPGMGVGAANDVEASEEAPRSAHG
jgi:transposase-like protein